MELFLKYTGWSQLCIFQQKKVTTLVISQRCLHFKCMKVNVLDKGSVIKIQDLKKIMVLYRSVE